AIHIQNHAIYDQETLTDGPRPAVIPDPGAVLYDHIAAPRALPDIPDHMSGDFSPARCREKGHLDLFTFCRFTHVCLLAGTLGTGSAHLRGLPAMCADRSLRTIAPCLTHAGTCCHRSRAR